MTSLDTVQTTDAAKMDMITHEPARWKCYSTVHECNEDGSLGELVAEIDGNILVTAGLTALLTLLIGGGGTAFNNANSYIGVGDSSTAEAIGQTDLQAATNKFRKAMDATYPSVSGNVVTFRSTFASADAQYAWNEFGVFNASSSGTMLNRKVSSIGTKAAVAWTFTVTITIS
jgi:hypothetical protein